MPTKSKKVKKRGGVISQSVGRSLGNNKNTALNTKKIKDKKPEIELNYYYQVIYH